MSARELAGPIIAMTVVLISAYVPVGFQGGLTGALFIEFAFTLAGAVTISAIVALTLSPMCCAEILKPVKKGTNTFEDRAVQFVDRCADWLTTRYRAALADSLKYTPVTLVFGALILTSIYWLYSNSKSELAPIEDQNLVLVSAVSSPDATLDQKLLYGGEIAKILNSMPQTRSLFQIYQSGQDITGVVFSSPGKRKESANELQAIITSKLSDISGQKLVAFQMPPLPGAQGLPIQFVVQTTENFNKLNLIAKDILSEAIKTGRFIYLDTDLKIDQPQTTFVLDREKSAQLGLTMNDIGGNLTSGLSGGYVNFFSLDGRSYKVIPQLAQSFRLNPDQLLDSYLRTEAGNLVPVSAVATIENTVVAQSLNHFQQLNSVTFQGVASPGVIDSEALDTLKTIAEKFLPSGYAIDYSGQSRQFIQETSGFIYTFGFALIIVFLALAALFESFRDPLIVLVSVPMSIAGAMVFIMLGFGGVSNNIYTQVGLVTLMGLISKHGILIVEFANEERRKGASKLDAILDAASIRLRPILMTTAAMVLGVLPLLIAGGAGAASRFNIGVVIVSGLSIGTLFTLFVLPAVYLHIAEDHKENSNGTAAIAEK
jgi:multidrug efflux pump